MILLPAVDIRDGRAVRLRQGDYRQVLVDASAQEPNVARAPVTLVVTDVVWRNAMKYQAREYRHAFWDSGTLLANTLAMAAAHRVVEQAVTPREVQRYDG